MSLLIGIVYIVLPLLGIFFLVQFVKWAWAR
jgi:hypothetical protein